MTISSAYFSVTQDGSATIVQLSRADVMDANYSRQVEIELGRLAGSLQPPRLVVDLSNVEYISSATIGMLIAVNRAVHAMDGELRIARLTPSIREVFRITRLDRKIHLCDTVAEAVASLG